MGVRVFDDHWRPLATTGAGARYAAHTLPGTTTLLEHPIRLRRTKVKRGCLLRRLWGRLIVSEFGVCPPRASTSGAGPRYALIRRYMRAVAHGSPVSAHERPSVSEGARRCQGVLAFMGANGRTRAHRGDQWRRSSVHAFGVPQFRALRLPKMLLKWSLCPREQGRRGPP